MLVLVSVSCEFARLLGNCVGVQVVFLDGFGVMFGALCGCVFACCYLVDDLMIGNTLVLLGFTGIDC